MVLLDTIATIWWYLRLKLDWGKAVGAAALATLAAPMFVQLVSPPADAATEAPRVVAVHSSSTSQVSMILEAPEAQPDPVGVAPEMAVTVEGTPVTTTVRPLASPDLSVALVIDTAADMTAEALEAAQSGATEYLLRLPERASTMVIASGGEPRVVAPLSRGPADAVSAISELRPGGVRSTTAATVLAAHELATAPPGPRVIIVYANGSDEAGSSAEQITQAVSAAQAAVHVVQTHADDDIWSQVVADAGGEELRTATTDLVQAFGQMATALSRLWILTFDPPGALPAVAEVAVTTGDVRSSATVTLPAASTAGTALGQPNGDESDGSDMRPVAIVLAGLVLMVLAVLAAIHRGRQRTAIGSEVPSAMAESRAGPPQSQSDHGLLRRSSHDQGRPAPNKPPRAPDRVVRRGRTSEPSVAPLRSRIGSRIAARATVADGRQQVDQGRNAKIVLAGSDDAVVNLSRNVLGPAAVHITGNPASRYFGVRSLGTADDLVITLRPYEGIRPLAWDGGESTGFEVTATGSWKIEVLPLSAIPTFSTQFNGSGDMVVRFDGDASLAEIAGNTAGRYFFVRAFGPPGTDILVNTSRPYRGTCQIGCGPQFFAVQAIGSWAITVK